MTPEDRELLHVLRRKQLELQRSLAHLDEELQELESRVEVDDEAPVPELPPVPAFQALPPPPSIPAEPPMLPPLPPVVASIPLPPLPEPPAEEPRPSLEFQFGRWLTRIGAVFVVLFLISADSYFQLHRLLGPWGKLGLGAAFSVLLTMLGQRLERKNADHLIYGRTLMAAGLGGLYVTLYAACTFEGLRVIHNSFVAGLLLLWWSAYVLSLAERRQSQAMALFAITLAYFSTAINPIGRFTMAADLVLASTSALLLIRNGWAALSYFSLVGTYLALLRRLIVDEDGNLVFETTRMLPFAPYAVYLLGAWFIFTAAITFCSSVTFRSEKRLAFLSLNNGAMTGLLLLTAYIAGYGHGALGSILLAIGVGFLFTSRFVGWTRHEPEKVMAAYAAQGLGLITAGIIVLYTGITRGFLLMLETLFLGLAGEFAGDRILKGATYFAAFFATVFLIWEMAVNAHHPWIFGFGGALVMLLNAWWARSDLRNSAQARNVIVLSSSYYCVLALGLISTALSTHLSDEALPPALAFAALALTFLIYLVSIYELPPLAQTLLIAAQGLVLFPAETGEDLPWWTTAWVGAVTLLMITWWSRQKITRTGSWIILLNLVYALALAGLSYETIRPRVDDQGWMVSASLLAMAFLSWGAFTRVWAIAGVGQLFLGIAVLHFFYPPGGAELMSWPWTTWAAALPIVAVFATGRATQKWLLFSHNLSTDISGPLRFLAWGYLCLAFAMFVRWIFATVPVLDQVATFLFLGTLFISWNVRHESSFGIRCGLILNLLGIAVLLVLFEESWHEDARALVTFFNACAFLALLLQPALLHTRSNPLITVLENWGLLLVSSGAGLFFASLWVVTRWSPGYLTLGWALFSLFLFLLGLLVGEKRQRWCGLAILCVAILRVFACDLWGLSTGYRVLTLGVLIVITLGVGYLLIRFADRRSEDRPSSP